MRTHRFFTFNSRGEVSIPLARIIIPIWLGAFALISLPRFIVWKDLCHRSLECASLFRTNQGPFHPGFSLERNQTCGDLPTLSNRPEYCHYRHEIFETDPWGFRNSQSVFESKASIAIFGDSYAYGQGLSQEETPAEVLSLVLSEPVYDAAGKLELEYLRWVLDHRPEIKSVLFFHLERHRHRKRELQDFEILINEDSLPTKVSIFYQSLSMYNPLKIILTRWNRAHIDNAYFSNSDAQRAIPLKLQNHKEFLFLPVSVQNYRPVTSVQDDSEFFSGLRDILKSRGISLHVVLIPEKYSAYHQLLEKPMNPYVPDDQHYLTKVEEALKMLNVPVLNLLRPFQDLSREELSKGRYIYWPDDTHWSGEAIRKMSVEVGIKFFPEKEKPPAP